MITIYRANTTDFNNNGLAVLDKCIKAEVTEELNGSYSLELEYPLFENDKWQYLIEDNIVKCPTPRGLQLFRIKYKTKTFSTISIYALHIFYDLTANFIEDLQLTNSSGSNAAALIQTGTQYNHNFKITSNITNIGSAEYLRKNPVDAIMGSDGFLSTWKGEILRDNYNIQINGTIGSDRGFTIQYGKNMSSITDKSDYSNIATRIMPIAKDESGNDLLLPEKYIDSPLINSYPFPHITTKEYNDLKVNSNADQGTILTQDQVFTQMRMSINNLYSVENVDKPVLDLEVDFVELSKTNEYKYISVLQQVYLGDIVTVKHTNIGIDQKAKVTKYTYDSILEKYMTITLNSETALSNQSISLADTIHSVKLSVDDVKAISNKIKSAMGGYVVKRESEILIMDTPDISTATKCWRWCINGLAYSKTGYNGAYEVAITMDGEINANFIKTGELDASLIKAGVITSQDGSLQLDLSNGHLSLKNNGLQALDMYGNNIDFHDWSNSAGLVGSIGSTHNNATGASGISMGVKQGCEMVMGTMATNADGSYTFTPMLRVDSTGSTPKLNLYGEAHIQGTLYSGPSASWSGTVQISDSTTLKFDNGILVGV